MVLDTGGGSSDSTYGVVGVGNTDIRDNTVDGALGTSGSNTSVYGIPLDSGVGARVTDNTVRQSGPSGSAEPWRLTRLPE